MICALSAALAVWPVAGGAKPPAVDASAAGARPVESDYVIHDFHFASANRCPNCGCTTPLSANCTAMRTAEWTTPY